MTRKAAGEKTFRRLIMDFHEGRAGRADVARHIHSRSTSISLRSLIASLQVLFPHARITCHQAEVPVHLLCATEARMEKAKYELVCLLFDEADTFDSYNRQFFEDHPITAARTGGGRYAILDGHHRVRRFAELTGGGRPITLTMVASTSPELLERFRREVQDVRREAGTTDVRKLPLT